MNQCGLLRNATNHTGSRYLFWKYGLKLILKLGKLTFKNVDRFFEPLLDKPIHYKPLIFTAEILHVLELTARMLKAQGVAKARPLGRTELAKAPHPGLTRRANSCSCLRGGRVGRVFGRNWRWLKHIGEWAGHAPCFCSRLDSGPHTQQRICNFKCWSKRASK